MPNLLNQFKSYLLGSKHISPSTVKNYVSDINHFLSFVGASIQEPEIKPQHITPAIIKAYRLSLTQPTGSDPAGLAGSVLPTRSDLNRNARLQADSSGSVLNGSLSFKRTDPNVLNVISPASINRKLSSLRRFGAFLADTKLLDSNPAQAVTNLDIDPTLTQVINHYKKHLQTEELSRSTIKNYVSDLKKYLSWAQINIKTTDNNLNQRKLN